MAGFTDYTAQAILNHLVGKQQIFTMPQVYVGLFTAVGSDGGAGFTEVIGGGYARVAMPPDRWNDAAGSSPSIISNSQAVIFPNVDTAWSNVIGFGIFDAAGGGHLLAWDYFGNYQWQPTTISLGTPAVWTQPAHGYAMGDRVVFSTEFGGQAPAGTTLTGLMTIQTVDVDTFGVGLNTTSSGEGMVRKVLPQSIQPGIQPLFAAGSLSIASS